MAGPAVGRGLNLGPAVGRRPQGEKHKERDFRILSRWPRCGAKASQREKHKEFDFRILSRWPRRWAKPQPWPHRWAKPQAWPRRWAKPQLWTFFFLFFSCARACRAMNLLARTTTAKTEQLEQRTARTKTAKAKQLEHKKSVLGSNRRYHVVLGEWDPHVFYFSVG